ncbi:MAG: hypothetical protein ACRD0C_21675, partial [Acidimicrobiia bacterium]
GGDRALVIRALVDGGPDSVVVKAFDPARAGEGWVREAAALRLAGERGGPVPGLLAVTAEPPLVVAADLGGGSNVADALVGTDPVAAVGALARWADSLAHLHRVTAGAAAAYADALAAYAGDLPVDVDTTGAMLADAAATLDRLLPRLGVTPDPAVLDVLRGASVGGVVALSPGDTCPDNNVSTATGLVLVDFEAATVRAVAWDVAYLQVPWPSCWCAWRLPADVAGATVARWRAAALPALPSAAHAGFDTDLAAATTAWAFVSASWFLERALADDPAPADPRLLGLVPTRRAMIQHRLAVAAESPALPPLGALAEEVLTATRRRWGVVPLDLAPAFR